MDSLTLPPAWSLGFGAGTTLAFAGVVLANRRTLFLSLAISFAAVSSTSPVFAQTAPEPASALSVPPVAQAVEPLPPTETYSAQIVAADLGAFLGFFLIAGSTNHAAFLLLPPLAAPAVHVAHGHVGRAAASFLLNVSLPTAGAFIGFSVESPNCGGEEILCGMGGLVLGGLTGIAAAIVIDAAVLARLPDEESARGRLASSHAVTPLVAVNRDGGLSLGLGGRF